MSLAMSLRGRGPAGSAARASKVLSRFGATAGAMARRLERYDALAARYGARVTWPATASVLARHPDLLKAHVERGVEIALHGLVHGDHANLGAQFQRETIARALAIFERSGYQPSGFRGPYLRYNATTLDVARELGLRWHSSQAVLFPLVEEPDPSRAPAYERALELYSALDARRVAVVPRLRDGLVDIPVAIPDDEILLERLVAGEDTRIAQWRAILDLTYERAELFTVQLHPERIDELATALEATLAEARRRRPVVYVATLDEIARWWVRRSRFSLRVVRLADERHRVHLDAADDATLLVRTTSDDGTRDAVAETFDFEMYDPRAPVVGVSERTPRSVLRFLGEEGWPFEVSSRSESFGAYIDVAGEIWAETEILRALDRAPGPLVHIGRWPNGSRSALAVTGDIDALTLFDFAVRSWETRRPELGGWSSK